MAHCLCILCYTTTTSLKRQQQQQHFYSTIQYNTIQYNTCTICREQLHYKDASGSLVTNDYKPNQTETFRGEI